MDINLNRPQMGPGMGARASKLLIVPGVICILLGVGVMVDEKLLQWLVAGAFIFLGLILLLLGMKLRRGFQGFPPGMM